MFLLFIIIFLNGVISQNEVANVYRFNFGGGFQIGIWEISMVLGLILAFTTGFRYTARLPAIKTDPLYNWTVALLAVGIFIGIVGDLIYGSDIKETFTAARDFGSIAICMIIGYRLTPNLRMVRPFLYLMIIAGFFTATILINHFGENAELAGVTNSFNMLRTINYPTVYAGLACFILIFSVCTRRMKLLPLPLAILVAAYCLVGQWAPFNRGDWVAVVTCFVLLPFFLPKERRVMAATRILIAIPLLLVGLVFAVSLASAVTQRDMGKKITDRLMTMLPDSGNWQSNSGEEKAWDARWPAAKLELEMWLENPLMGKGMTADARWMQQRGVIMWGFNHNGWASVLARMGIIGFAGTFLVYFSLIRIGRRVLREADDPYVQLFGFAVSIGGVFLLLQCVVTMAWTVRIGLLDGTLLGIAFKVHDLLQLKESVATEEEYAYAPLEFAFE